MQVLLQFFRTSPCFFPIAGQTIERNFDFAGVGPRCADYSGRVPSIAAMQEMTQLRKATIGAYTAPTQVSVAAD
tara:strand:- start:12382 stop:12603 length:222 start_codon:yes stop_codon:yes gene_type:complete